MTLYAVDDYMDAVDDSIWDKETQENQSDITVPSVAGFV